jgi:rRNA processing protein Krr1/Pno1
MSEAQAATPEQQERMKAAVTEAQQRAMQEVQQNLQIELQMRANALNMAVNANENTSSDPVVITKAAAVFLDFLKRGEA